ncbi:HEAT repeat domain-containing protein [Parapedobacter koreensis]|uniref:HEAT repeat-containing protein n=1 Tax=Parapedobacter koreensis TaxID=332977 RepID=A0A1H7IML5_9SPHI|nr:HEAT repeat domain-containing protein [Parapedobacter koreensis]SEK63731.1 HEAT repeat-containing protein [Parapedobacter koreensis]
MIKENITELEKKWVELLKSPKRLNAPKITNTKIVAAELQTQLLQDEEYQKWIKEKDEVRAALEAAYAQDEKPLVEDLVKAGMNIRSSWDLVNAKSSYKSAIPILIEHLSKPYCLKNKEGIIRALAVKEAKGVACKTILDEYNKTEKKDANYRWSFGNTMAVIMTADYIGDVLAIVQDESNGDSRHMFVTALGNTKSSKAEETLKQLLTDKSEVIRKEAQKALKKIN